MKKYSKVCEGLIKVSFVGGKKPISIYALPSKRLLLIGCVTYPPIVTDTRGHWAGTRALILILAPKSSPGEGLPLSAKHNSFTQQGLLGGPL